MDENKSPESFGELLQSLRRLLTLNIDYARLTVAEKVSILLSTMVVWVVVGVLVVLALLFVSIGVGHVLAQTIAPVMAYLLVAAFYVLLLIVVVALRRRLFVDPIARFISRLFCKPPCE